MLFLLIQNQSTDVETPAPFHLHTFQLISFLLIHQYPDPHLGLVLSSAQLVSSSLLPGSANSPPCLTGLICYFSPAPHNKTMMDLIAAVTQTPGLLSHCIIFSPTQVCSVLSFHVSVGISLSVFPTLSLR